MVIKLIRNAFLRNTIEGTQGNYKITFTISATSRTHTVYAPTKQELLRKVDALYDRAELSMVKERAQGSNL